MGYPARKKTTKDISKFLQSRALLYFVLLLLILRFFSVAIFVNFPQNIFLADIAKMALENFVNQTRQSLGLNTLVESQKLNDAAKLKAEDMVKNEYFSHTSPTGVSPWFWFSKVGYNYKYAGENLAIGFFDSKEVYNAWFDSPSHRENLLNPNYKEIGTAVLEGFGQNNAIVVVQLFGSSQPIPAKENQNVSKPAEKTENPKEINPTNEPAQQAPEGKKVLSQSTEILQRIEYSGVNNLYSRFLNFVLYNYNELLQGVVYGVSLAVASILLAVIFLKSDIFFKREFVFRSVILVILLSFAIFLDKEIIISIIPHKIII